MGPKYHPVVYQIYNVLKTFTTPFSNTLTDGIYAFDLYEDPNLIPLLRVALLHIYKGTYYVRDDQYREKFMKPGNLMIAYLENGKPMVATCLLWTDINNLVMEIGQGYSLTPKKPFKFTDLSDFFLKLYRPCRAFPILFISTCRKSATDAISEMFGMKMTGLFIGPSLRVDFERFLERNHLDPSSFKGTWYNILYQILNYHFELFESRIEKSMVIPDFLRINARLEKFWSYYPYEKFPIPYKTQEISPIVLDFGFDESNHQIVTTIWPICHPDLPKKLQELEMKKTEAIQNKKPHETILGTAGPYFFDPIEKMYITGIIFAKGTMYPYYYNVEDELDVIFTDLWRKYPSDIQEMLKVAFYGFNVTEETRCFFRNHEDIFNGLMLNPQLFRGLTLDEKSKIVSIMGKYPVKLTEKEIISKLDKIIIKK